MARQSGKRPLFSHEVRRDGRTVATLHGIQDDDGGFTVETEIYPVTVPGQVEPQRRPFSFPTREQATRFVEETLMALEYLGCAVAE
jgi:hypothetical protein